MALVPLACLLLPAIAAAQQPTPTYTLQDLLARARLESPALATSRAEQLSARAGIITARARPNPEISFDPGRLTARRNDVIGGASSAISISQPIESPWLREARLNNANARVELAVAQTGALQSNLNAAIRDRFFDLLRLRAEQQALQEDLQLTEQIRDRVEVRVRTGEAPRFDSLRAEAEVATVRKNVDATALRQRQARFALRQLVSPNLEADFEIGLQADDSRLLTETDYLALKYAVVERNPDVVVAREAVNGADLQIELERQQIIPSVTLRATHERDPSSALTRVGAHITIPLLNRREGPIAEARANAERARLALDQRRFEADASFEGAWQAYRAALSQVQAIEGGILERSRRILAVAEAAYRLGERGILEYLDAQRQFRLVRNELLTARFELQRARTDLERLAGR
ncbi:MAG TPA: TolC family protein [Burkholderiaceae bacterium]|nr:TolC family protein [Burkholderiaceae bacterium]